MIYGSESNQPTQASNLLHDFFEDNMLEEVASLDSKDDDEDATGTKTTTSGKLSFP